jgi:excisionase family DNA binding protein
MTLAEREIVDRTVKLVEDLVARALEKIDRLVKKIEAAQRGELQEWFTVRQTAEMLGKSPYTIRDHVKRGTLKAVRVERGAGGKGEWRISREEIKRFIGPGWPVAGPVGDPAA